MYPFLLREKRGVRGLPVGNRERQQVSVRGQNMAASDGTSVIVILVAKMRGRENKLRMRRKEKIG